MFNVIYVKKRKQSDVTQTVEDMRMQQCCGRHDLGFFSTDEGTLDYYEPVEIKEKSPLLTLVCLLRTPTNKLWWQMVCLVNH